MKLLDEVKTIVSKYDLKPIVLPEGHFNIYDEELRKGFFNDKIHDDYLCEKYLKHIPKGWYGFAIGKPIVPEWMNIIDEVLELCIKNDPDFEIHQIKLKFGGIRFYCHSSVIEDIFDIESHLEDNLYDKALVY
jgi:hypothetical protein